jgi:putative transposase
VYVWADGIHFNVRLEDDDTCLLVLIGARSDGSKELLAVHDGYRESKLSWLELLRDLRARGLKGLPSCATGDGALGFWAALEEECPMTREQRCWVHKTANILDKMPKGVQGKAKQRIHDMYMAETKKDALRAYDEFLHLYEAKFPKACECLKKDKDVLFTFYDFPAEHWIHLRTTNPIESTFATVRHRTRRTKGCGSRIATLTMVFKLAREAEKHWRKLNKHELVTKVIEGVKFVDGIMKDAA